MRLFLVIVFLLTQFIYSQNNYLELHKNALVIDTHADVLLQVLRGSDISKN